jgi:hypothetical protein
VEISGNFVQKVCALFRSKNYRIYCFFHKNLTKKQEKSTKFAFSGKKRYFFFSSCAIFRSRKLKKGWFSEKSEETREFFFPLFWFFGKKGGKNPLFRAFCFGKVCKISGKSVFFDVFFKKKNNFFWSFLLPTR